MLGYGQWIEDLILDPDFAKRMRSGRHSGFSAHAECDIDECRLWVISGSSRAYHAKGSFGA